MDSIYQDITLRTGGNIYIGVVGPVRTGKSTLIKRIMEEMVIPAIDDPYRKERAKDELPQSGSGRMIMTSEPKFVPEEAEEISPDGKSTMRIRMIDSVGYMVDGAVGAEEDGVPRMVTTPWYDHEIPMTEAAELGTKKVMDGHCTVGLVVTTDGTVTDIPRQDYIAAERRAIRDMQASGKPYVVIVNSSRPNSEEARQTADYIRHAFDVEPVVRDCLAINMDGICQILQSLLYAFPMEQLQVYLPRWMDALERDHPVKAALYAAFLEKTGQIHTLGQAEEMLRSLQELPGVQEYTLKGIDLGTGSVSCSFTFPEELYYEILSSKAGMEISNDAQLLSLLIDLSQVKKKYDRISDALASAQTTGYGVVMPTAEELHIDSPELMKKGGSFGVRLKAGAPSIHMMRVDIDTEISPMVGDEKQSRDLIAYLTGEGNEKLGQSNIFGKSVYDLLQDGLSAKVIRLPEDVRHKFRGTLTKIVNDGASGLICLIL